MQIPETVVGAQQALTVYALVVLGTHTFAVPAAQVQQALPRPDTLTRLPSRDPALQGVLKLREHMVPVVDLRHWTEPDTPHQNRPPLPQLLVLGSQGRQVAIGVDAIQGLLRVPAEHCTVVSHQAADEHLFHSVLNAGDDAAPVPVLDPDRLMRLAQAWAPAQRPATDTACDTDTPSQHPAQARTDSLTEALAVVRMGEALLGVPTAAVLEVGAVLGVQRVLGGNRWLTAMTRWRGIDLPLLDPTPALGLTLDRDPPLGDRPLCLVLQHDGRHLALPVDETVAVQRLPRALLQAAAEAGVAQAHLYTGVLRLDSGPHTQRLLRVLDAPALLAWLGMDHHPPSTPSPAAGQWTATGAPPPLLGLDAPAEGDTPQAYVVVDLGREVALPLALLQGVMNLPEDFRPEVGDDPQQKGHVTWRGQTLPVLNLCSRPAAGPPGAPNPGAQQLLVVRHGQRSAGLLVRAVLALLPAAQVEHRHLRLPGQGRLPFITTGQPPHSRSHEVLDLGQLRFFQGVVAGGP